MAGPPPSSTMSTMEDEHALMGFLNNGFMRDETIVDMKPTILQQPIHAMFRPSNFAKSDFDYVKLTTSLRLLTHFVKVCLPFFHAIFARKRKATGDFDHEGRPIFELSEPQEKLTPQEAELTWQALEIMSENLAFVRQRNNDGLNASCRPLIQPDVPLGPLLLGNGSEIAVSNALYNELIESQNGPHNIVQQQLVAFEFAKTMLHELGHAAFFASVPRKFYFHQIYIGEKGRSTEHGYEIVAWLFGGNPEYDFTIGYHYNFANEAEQHHCCGKMQYLTEWPCPSKCLTNGRHSMPFVTRGEDLGVEVIWRGRFAHINAMFQDSFWGEVVPREGRQALHFQKDYGYRFVPKAEGDGPPLQPHPLDTVGVPAGYFADKNGIIRKRVDKAFKLDQVRGKEAELSRAAQDIESRGVVDGWRSRTCREKLSEWSNKVLAKLT